MKKEIPKYSIIAELQVSPRSQNTISLSKPIKETLRILKNFEGLIIETHAMGTNIECNDLNILLDAIKKVQIYLIQNYPRVVISLKIDQRTDKPNRSMKDKIESVK